MINFIAIFNLLVVLGLIYLNRTTLMNWRCSLRREVILAEGFRQMGETLATGEATYQDAVEVLSVTGVRLADEFNNQMRHDRQGVPIREISARAGHARPSMTLDVYSHIVVGGEVPVAALREALA